MRAALVAVLLAIPASARAQRAAGEHDVGPRDTTGAPTRDRWLGGDKAKHFFLGGFTYAGGYAGARLVGARRTAALTLAVVPAAIASVGKEVRDHRSYGHFSVRDLVADALGVAAYATVLAHTGR